MLCSHVGNALAGSGREHLDLLGEPSADRLRPTGDRAVQVPDAARQQAVVELRQIGDLRDRHEVISPEPPNLVFDAALLVSPLNAHQGEPRFVEVMRTQRGKPLVLDPVAALQRLLRRSRQIVVADRREYAGEPVQRVHVPFEERLLALRLKRHHETRPREAGPHQEHAEHHLHAGQADRRLTPVDLRGHPRIVHLLTERLRGKPKLAAPLADVITHRGPGDHDTVLLREAISDPLRRVPLLTRRRLIGDQDLIDPLPPPAQRRRGPALRPFARRRDRRLERLADRPPMHLVPACQRVRRQPVELVIPPDLLEQLHS